MKDSPRSVIAGLHAAGMTEPEIARHLGLAAPTVSYHVRRAREMDDAVVEDQHGAASDRSAGPPESRSLVAHTISSTRTAVAALLDAGLTRAQAARELGLSKATVSYHARRLDRPIDERCARRYDWEAIQRHYDAGHSVRECIEVFGFSSASWFDAVKRGAIQARPAGMPIEDLLKMGTYRGRYHLKTRLIREGLKAPACERCGLTDWRGEPLTLALHHVNGVRDDNRLENLQLLCPNCHSQTNTFAGRNLRSSAAAGD